MSISSQIKFLEDEKKRLEESISLVEDESFKQSKVFSLTPKYLDSLFGNAFQK